MEQPGIFRFKFTKDFTDVLFEFAQLHRFDNRIIFKEAWTLWIEENHTIVDDEISYLKGNGYEGSIIDKMYKSARYYFRKKNPEKSEPKERRRYVNVDINIIVSMDSHIIEWCRRKDFKPANAFSNFCEQCKSELEAEVLRLYSEENIPEKDIPTKLKKTYKNRYYQIIKVPLLTTVT